MIDDGFQEANQCLEDKKIGPTLEANGELHLSSKDDKIQQIYFVMLWTREWRAFVVATTYSASRTHWITNYSTNKGGDDS